jgi:hypothetical protein
LQFRGDLEGSQGEGKRGEQGEEGLALALVFSHWLFLFVLFLFFRTSFFGGRKSRRRQARRGKSKGKPATGWNGGQEQGESKGKKALLFALRLVGFYFSVYYFLDFSAMNVLIIHIACIPQIVMGRSLWKEKDKKQDFLGCCCTAGKRVDPWRKPSLWAVGTLLSSPPFTWFSMSSTDMPEEVLLFILGWLPPRDLLTCSGVNWRLRALSLDDSFWRCPPIEIKAHLLLSLTAFRWIDLGGGPQKGVPAAPGIMEGGHQLGWTTPSGGTPSPK